MPPACPHLAGTCGAGPLMQRPSSCRQLQWSKVTPNLCYVLVLVSNILSCLSAHSACLQVQESLRGQPLPFGSLARWALSTDTTNSRCPITCIILFGFVVGQLPIFLQSSRSTRESQHRCKVLKGTGAMCVTSLWWILCNT